MKRILALMLLVLFVPLIKAYGQTTFTVSSVKYTTSTSDATKVSITGTTYTTSSTVSTLTLPSTVTSGGTTYTVTSIAAGAFKDINITALTIDGIPEIATTTSTNPTFNKVGKVTLRSGVTTIGNYTFYGNTALTGVTCVSTLATIGTQAFKGCTALTSVTSLPKTVSIGQAAFAGCSKLYSITLPDKVPGTYAFQGCNFSTVTIPSGWTSVPAGLYANNPLSRITIPSTVTSISTLAFASTTAKYSSLIIPASVRYIYAGAFAGNNEITTLKFEYGTSALSLYANAFAGITSMTFPSSPTTATITYDVSATSTRNITTIYADRTTVPTISAASAFTLKTFASAKLTVPEGYNDTYKAAKGWGTAYTTNGSDYFKSTWYQGFEYNGVRYQRINTTTTNFTAVAPDPSTGTSTTNLTISSPVTFDSKEYPVTTITAGAFKDISITNLTIKGVATISNATTSKVTFPKVYNVIFEDGVKTVGNYTFNANTYLRTINCASKDLNSISTRAFEGCTALTTLTLPDSVLLSAGAFAGCTKLTSVTLPSKRQSTGNYIFQGCSITEVSIPEGWTAVPASMFANNPLSKITLPSTVKVINTLAFASTTATYDELTIPAAVTTINAGAFATQNTLTKLTFEASDVVLDIKDNAFAYLTTLTYNTSFTASPTYSATGRSITNINADRTVPPTLAATSFTTTAYNNAKLSISDDNLEAYQNAAGWLKDASGDYKAFKASNLLSAFVYGGARFTVNVSDPTSVTVSGPDPAMGTAIESLTLTSPVTYKETEYTVTNIAAGAFFDVSITDLNISKIPTITNATVAKVTFNKAQRVVIGEGVETVGRYTFCNNSVLDSLVMTPGVNLGIAAFSNCPNLKSVVLPTTQPTGSYVFQNCGITNVVIPEGWTNVPDGMFAGCPMTGITLASTVQTISKNAFASQKAKYPQLIIPGSVTSIGDNAFATNATDAITTLTFEPSDAEMTIGAYGFGRLTTYTYDAESPTSPTVTCNNANWPTISVINADRSVPPTLQVTSFSNNTYNNTKLTVSGENLEAYSTASGWGLADDATGFKKFKNILSGFIVNGVKYTSNEADPSTVTAIGPDPSLGSSVETLSIISPITFGGTEYSVTSIAGGAFKDFTINNLTITNVPEVAKASSSSPTFNRAINVVIGDGVKRLGDFVFNGNTEMQSLTIGKDVTYVGQRLCGNTSATGSNAKMKLIIPTENAIDSIGLAAFGFCAAIDGNLSLPNLTWIGNFAFTSTSITGISMPKATTIGIRVFENCKELASVSYPNTVSLDDGVFVNCEKLTEVILPATVPAKTFIFEGCNISKVTIPETWSSVPTGIFANNPISEITIPVTVARIERLAFASPKSTYTTVTIPAAVKFIGAGAFAGNNNLSELTFVASDSTLSIDQGAFVGLESYTYPNSPLSPVYTYNTVDREIEVIIANRTVAPTLNKTTFTTNTYQTGELSTDSLSVYMNALGWGKADAAQGYSAFTRGLTSFFFNGIKYSYETDRSKVIVSGPAEEVTEAIETLTLTSPITFRGKEYTVTSVAAGAFKDVAITNLNITGIETIQNALSSTVPFNKVENVVIGDGVKTIGNYAFYNNRGMKSLTIGKDVVTIGNYLCGDNVDRTKSNSQMKLVISNDNSIESIGNYAFNWCDSVTGDIVLPKLRTIGNNSLSSTGITSLKLPVLKAVNTQSFAKNAALRTVVLGDSLTSIGGRAFDSCSQLDSVSYPVTATIAGSAFALCSNLKSIALPNTVSTSTTYAFIGCGLTKVNIPETWTMIPAGLFAGNPISEITIPATVTTIGNNAFASDVATYKTVTIPAAVTSIGTGAFAGSNNLDSLTFEAADEAQTIGANAFTGVEIEYNLTTPNSSKFVYDGETVNDRVIATINANRTVAPTLAVNTFTTATYENCDLSVPDEISSVYTAANGWGKANTSTGYKAFSLGLTEFSVGNLKYSFANGRANVILTGRAASAPESFETLNLTSPVTYKGKEYPVASVRSGAFKDVAITNLNITGIATIMGSTNASTFNKAENVVLGEGVVTLGAYTFNNPDMKSLTIGKDLQYIGNYAFGNVNAEDANTKMKLTISEDNSIKEVGIRAFSHGAAITGPLTLPNVTNIQNYAFNNTGITSLVAPKCTKIGRQAFDGCAALETVVYADSVDLQLGAFTGCAKLSAVNIPAKQPATTATNIFAGCNLQDANIPEGWEVIPSGMFANNPLAQITIPSTVTTVSSQAFASVSATYTTVTIPANVTTIGAGAFAGNNNLTSLTFDSSVSSQTIGDNAFAGLTDLQVTAAALTADYNNGVRVIDSINANRTRVPGVQANTFTTATYASAIITVPVEYDSSYRNATGWGKANESTGYQAFASWFVRIEDEETGATYIADDEGSATVTGYTSDSDNPTELNLTPTIERNGKVYTVRVIAPNAFQNKPIVKVSVPTTIRTIGSGAFMNCPLKFIEFVGAAVKKSTEKTANGDETEDDVDDPSELTEIGEMAFASPIAEYTTLEIPGTVTTIGNGAFAGNNKISSLSIYAAEPMGKKTIGSNAFSGLDNVTRDADGDLTYNESREISNISSYPLVPPTIENNTFTSTTYNTAKLTIPDGYYETEDKTGYKDATGWSNFLEENITLGVDLTIFDGIYGDVYRVYDLNGTLRLRTTDRTELRRLPAGFYIINGKKILVK